MSSIIQNFCFEFVGKYPRAFVICSSCENIFIIHKVFCAKNRKLSAGRLQGRIKVNLKAELTNFYWHCEIAKNKIFQVIILLNLARVALRINLVILVILSYATFLIVTICIIKMFLPFANEILAYLILTVGLYARKMESSNDCEKIFALYLACLEAYTAI